MAKKKKKSFFKKVGRAIAKVHTKIGKIAIPVVSGVASAFVPGSGALITAAGARLTQYEAATAARAKGIKGRAARKIGRKAAQTVLKRGLMATAAGSFVGLGAAAMAGTSALTGIGGALAKRSSPAAAQSVVSDDLLPNQILTSSELAESLKHSSAGAGAGGGIVDTFGKVAQDTLLSTLGRPAMRTNESAEGMQGSGDAYAGAGMFGGISAWLSENPGLAVGGVVAVLALVAMSKRHSKAA